jgi:hypothetical protein
MNDKPERVLVIPMDAITAIQFALLQELTDASVTAVMAKAQVLKDLRAAGTIEWREPPTSATVVVT